MTPSISRFVPLALVALGLAGVAANCEQCQTASNPRRGNLDRAADAVLVTGDDGHAYAVVANPELQHLRVFDLTTEAFVFAPNAYFPLSVAVGPDTRRLAVADGDDTFVYALDATIDQLFVVHAGTGSFALQGAALATGRAPGDVAAFRADDTPVGQVDDDDDQHDGAIELWVTLPDESAVQVLSRDGSELARLHLDELDGVAARPDDVVADPLGDSIVVADATLPLVHIFSRADRQLERTLDVGGPVGSLSVGVIDIGDGLAPVVLALRRDAPIAVVIKLFRAAPEDKYAVLGSVEVPGLPLVGYVPDARPGAQSPPTVCCRELSSAAVDAGQATDAWAAVASADGKITYLQIIAGLVRIFDNDLEGTALGEPLVEAWVPQAGDEDREPVPSLFATDDFGDPPLVPLLDADEQLALTWQGSPPGLESVRGVWDGGASAFVAASADLQARGALVGDLALIAIEAAGPGCPDSVRGVIAAVNAGALTVTLDDPGDEPCLVGGGTLRVSVAPAAAFAVFDRDGDFLGRLAFDGELPLAGATVTVAASPLGPPTRRGSVLRIPINPHMAIIDLDLSDTGASFLASDGGGKGQGALLPVALVGGDMSVPGLEVGTQIRARRMVVATGANNALGTNSIFACDEGETIPGLCEEFR